LQNKTIVATDAALTLLTAIDHAFKKLARQLRDFKSMLRGDHLHEKSRALRNFMPQMPESEISAAAREKDLEAFRLGVVHQMTRILAHLEQEIARLRTRGIEFRTPMEDLVDEVVAEALDRFGEKPFNQTSEGWLLRIADDVISRREGRVESPTYALEEWTDVPEAPSAADDPFDGLNRLHFRGELELDEGRRFTEPRVILAASEDPSQQAEQEDLKLHVGRLLRELPIGQRRVFLLHIEGFDRDEIAQVVQMEPDRVSFHLRSAELFLRRRLAAALDLDSGIEVRQGA